MLGFGLAAKEELETEKQKNTAGGFWVKAQWKLLVKTKQCIEQKDIQTLFAKGLNGKKNKNYEFNQGIYQITEANQGMSFLKMVLRKSSTSLPLFRTVT